MPMGHACSPLQYASHGHQSVFVRPPILEVLYSEIIDMTSVERTCGIYLKWFALIALLAEKQTLARQRKQS